MLGNSKKINRPRDLAYKAEDGKHSRGLISLLAGSFLGSALSPPSTACLGPGAREEVLGWD